MQQRFYSICRNIIPLLLCLMLTVVLFIASGCKQKGGDPEPISDVQLGKLSRAWKLKNVTLDGASKKSDYASFQLTLAGTKGTDLFTYTTTARPSHSPWPASGGWSFGADVATQIIRDPKAPDALQVTYSVSDGALQLNFNFAGAGYASRISEVAGQWVFTFE